MCFAPLTQIEEDSAVGSLQSSLCDSLNSPNTQTPVFAAIDIISPHESFKDSRNMS